MPTLPIDPVQRRLVGGLVALLLLALLTAAMFLYPGRAGGWMTPLGLIAPLDLLAVVPSMAAGGAIARQGFRGWAVVLVILAGISSMIAAYGFAPPSMAGSAHWLLRNTSFQLLLSAVLAWIAADVGQRFAARRTRAT